jgi:hypothetical protein
MAFHNAQQQTLLFGGTNLDPTLKDTWAWDGANWNQIVSANGPEGLGLSVGMIYDPSQRTMLLLANPWPTIDGDGVKSFSPSELWVWR